MNAMSCYLCGEDGEVGVRALCRKHQESLPLLESENARLQAVLTEVLESRDNMAADIIRLQARVEEAEQRGVELWKVLYHYTLHSHTVRRLLAKAEALAERRKKALVQIEAMTIDYVATDKAAGHIAKVARAAIKEEEKA